MKIFTAAQLKQWDAFTIDKDAITSIDLMERAANSCTNWIQKHFTSQNKFIVCCGKGNNGGDGLAIARLLSQQGKDVIVYCQATNGSPDFQANLQRLQQAKVPINPINSIQDLPVINASTIIIDALFGAGLNRAPEGLSIQIIEWINQSKTTVISIDVPSGMYIDRSSMGNVVVKATHTLTFETYKLSFLLAENESNIGNLHILPIGLHQQFIAETPCNLQLLEQDIIQNIYRPRTAFSHKGTFGHALLVAGSYGKMGAAVLSARACLRSGVGLLSLHIPGRGYDVLQASVPEAMVMTDFNSSYNTKLEEDTTRFKSVGIGPGLGTASETGTLLADLLQNYPSALVIDADALNLLAKRKELLPLIPVNTILSPHPKEFERLFGKPANDFDAIDIALQKASELQVIIILKGHHTFIALPDGRGYFNNTGNAGMATGGSGDVLTGLLTGLLAQGYTPEEAALLGVYLHGKAGDVAAKKFSMEAMVAGDITECFAEVFLSLGENKERGA